MIGVTILGSTGSIGINTLDVLSRRRDDFEVVALTANRNVDALLRQCRDWRPRYAVVADPRAVGPLDAGLRQAGLATEALSGQEGLQRVAGCEEARYVMAAIVGAAGLLPTLVAAQQGKRVLLANKESLVMSGKLLMDAVRDNNAELLPVDSEHNAVFQCMPNGRADGVRRILLTASGGPFRTRRPADLRRITPAEACAHPNWDMGKKISVDCATMMNKGLEVIEACWLFDVDVDQVDVVIHPESIIHSLVEYADGSTLAQLGNPDMRTPIAHALAWPARMDAGVQRLNLPDVGQLNFEEPDPDRFPCLWLARQAMAAGGAATAILNAANEVAVQQFLDERIGYTDIARVVEQTLDETPGGSAASLEQALEADRQARARAVACCKRLTA